MLKTSAAKLFVAAFLIVVSIPSFAQTMPDVPPVGIPVGSTITTDGMDTVSLSNLAIHFNVPLRAKQGRGIPFSFNLSFDNQTYGTKFLSGGVQQEWTLVTSTHPFNSPIGTIHLTQFTNQSCIVISNPPRNPPQKVSYTLYEIISYTDSDGTSHPFGPSGEGLFFASNSLVQTACKLAYGQGASGIASDGSGIFVSANLNSGTITYPNGTIIKAPLYGLPSLPPGPGPYTITDSNGNWMSQSFSSAGFPQIGTFTDTLDTAPVILVNASTFPNPVSYSYLDGTGGEVPYITESFKPYTLQTAFGCPIVDYPATAGNLLDRITLPDGTFYSFTYEQTGPGSGNVTGRVSSITLPTGGVVTYQYTGGDTGKGVFCVDGSTSGLKRTTPDGTWNYVRGNVTMPTGGGAIADDTTTITDPLGNQTVIGFRWGSGVGSLFEKQRQVYTGSATGTPIESTVTCYNGQSPVSNCTSVNTNSVITQPFTEENVYRSLNGGPQSRVDTFYNNYGLVTEKDEYDFGAPTPTRKTITTYSTIILDHPATVKVTDGNGNPLAETDYTYDQDINNLQPSGSVQLNSVSCCRGNLTTLTKHVNGSSTITETFTHYDNGQVYQAKDGNGNTTTYTYGDCGNSLLSSVLYPVNNLTKSYAWDCNGAVVTQSTDFNSQTTTYQHADPLWRTTAVNYPDGGQTTATYNDTSSPPTEIQTKLITSSVSHTTQTNFDTYGRPVLAMSSDPEGTDYTTTTFDGDGRQAQVTNPYRSTSDQTYGVTTSQYDGLGRVLKVTNPDNSVVTTSYNQNCTTVTDEAGASRESCVDGLGRMTQVFEDPGSSPHLNYETDYTYDGLDNLLSVTQKGGTTNSSLWRTRTFTYDELSRLLTATNPESKQITYGYDANGNVISKLDARQITTTYTYDGLNRLTEKQYTDGTQSVFFSYDTCCWWGVQQTNTLGRLQEEWTGTSCCATAAEIFSYDPVGRVLLNTQYTQNMGYLPVNYTYDLAGDLTSATNGKGVTISYGYDSAQRPNSVTSNLIDSQHPATLFTVDPSVGYFPAGALRKGTYGNGLTETNVFNNRLQPCLLDVNSSNITLQTCNDSTPSGNLLDLWMGYGTTNNNGNVLNWNATGQQSFVRTYTYDSLNRLLTQSSTGSGGSFSWTVDPWGNRTAQTLTGGTGYAWSSQVNTNNQLMGGPYTYDLAGNLLTDGNHTYTYDAENRISTVDGATTYLYNAEGRRVEKVSGAWSDFIHDLSGNIVAEVDANGWATGYVYLGESLLAEYRDSTTYFVSQDHLGSTRLMTGVNQSVYDTMDYQPYGEQIAGDTGTTHKFTGKERDAETGDDYFGARYYGSTIGRFMQADPFTVTSGRIIDPQQLNLYSYVRNGPLKYVDPTGMVIDETHLSESDLEKWQQVEKLAAQTDSNGNLLHPELNSEIVTLQQDSRTYTLEGPTGLGPDEAGRFEITNFTADGKDFTGATIRLDFNKIMNGKNVTPANFNLDYSKFGGLNDNARRFAELVGHEFAHGLFATFVPGVATEIQRRINEGKGAFSAFRSANPKAPLPPDVVQKMATGNAASVPTERFAQQIEKVVNGELQASEHK
jgi:RHS repeat-associated protein